MPYIIAEEVSIEAQDPAREAVLRISDLEFYRELDLLLDPRPEFRVPELRVLLDDPIDEVDPEVQVCRLLTYDVLELLPDPCHPVLTVEGQDHRKSRVEEDPLEYHIVADEVLDEVLRPLDRRGREVRL